MKKKVFVGLSGGVDSAVSAALLKKEGYDVTGVFMKNWSGDEYGIADSCPWRIDLDDSKAVCEHLGIEHKIYNFEREYRSLVIENFFEEYKKGNTPNPDVLCNKYIKFDLFMKKALAEGADFIATGHYAQNIDDILVRGVDSNKDQSYFLYQITLDQLKKTLFPVGKYQKIKVRELAKEFGIPVSEKKDSQGICFVGKIDVRKFLESELPSVTGEFIDKDSGKIVGKHNGSWFYTIGQRRGIKIGGTNLPYFVVEKDIKSNIVYIAQGKSNPFLLSNKLSIESLHIINPEYLYNPKNLSAQIRYRGEAYKVKSLNIDSSGCKLEFENNVWAPAIGQSIVLYEADKCVGGGILTEILP